MHARSIALLEFPAVRERLAEHTSFGPSRRLAEVLEPSADPVIVARGLDETDQARALLRAKLAGRNEVMDEGVQRKTKKHNCMARSPAAVRIRHILGLGRRRQAGREVS